MTTSARAPTLATIPLRQESAALTDVGRRRKNNEDAFVAEPALGLYAVADGMGGHAAGEVASTMAMAAIRRAIPEAPDAAFLAEPSVTNRRRMLDWLSQLVTEISTAIHARAAEDPQLTGMGCTLDLALVRGRGMFLAHVGDSRVYGWHRGALHQLTEDHTFGQLLLSSNALTPEEIAQHPQRNALTRALGTHLGVQADTAYHELTEGEVLLLCSDGLHGQVAASRIQELVAEPPSRAVKALVQAALDAGGRDNVTAVVVSLGADQPPSLRPIIGSQAALEVLRRSQLFAAFTPGELVRVQKVALGRAVGAGADVLRQGETSEELFLLIEGALSVWRDGQRLGLLDPGDPFGGMMLAPMPMAVTVRAESPAILLAFPLSELGSLIGSDAVLAAKLTSALLERTMRRLVQLVDLTARYRSLYGELPSEPPPTVRGGGNV